MAEPELDGGVSDPSKATLIIRPARVHHAPLGHGFFLRLAEMYFYLNWS